MLYILILYMMVIYINQLIGSTSRCAHVDVLNVKALLLMETICFATYICAMLL
jgi:hypothetical protein